MSTIREFVEKSLKSGRIDFNGDNDYQCVELIKVYLRDVFWKTVWSLWDWKKTYLGTKKYWFEDFLYDKNFQEKRPKLWDVISFWATSWNKYGHTALVLGSDQDFIYVLEQNYWSWNWDWKWKNSLTIREKKYYNISGITRSSEILDKVSENILDKVSFYTWVHIWQNNIKRKNVLEPLFYFLAWYKDNLNWKNFKDLWIIKNLENNATRQELAYIILAFLNKILAKNLSLQDLQNIGIWNWQRPNDKVTGYEFTLMINKTKEVFGL